MRRSLTCEFSDAWFAECRWRQEVHVPRTVHRNKQERAFIGFRPRLMHHPSGHVVEGSWTEFGLLATAFHQERAAENRVGFVCRVPMRRDVLPSRHSDHQLRRLCVWRDVENRDLRRPLSSVRRHALPCDVARRHVRSDDRPGPAISPVRPVVPTARCRPSRRPYWRRLGTNADRLLYRCASYETPLVAMPRSHPETGSVAMMTLTNTLSAAVPSVLL